MSNDLTFDSLFSGKLTCLQRRNGYRFSIDAVLLAHFIKPKKNHRILDLGAGVGIISLILAYRWPQISISSLEIQKSLVSLIRKNIALNKFENRIEVIDGDLCKINELVTAGQFDWVVCNPPYYLGGAGRCSLHSEKAIARHQIEANICDILQAIFFALKNRGRAALVYPAEQSVALIQELANFKLTAKRLQVVHSYPGENGKLIMLEVNKGGGQNLEVLQPLYIYEAKDGKYSKELTAMYS